MVNIHNRYVNSSSGYNTGPRSGTTDITVCATLEWHVLLSTSWGICIRYPIANYNPQCRARGSAHDTLQPHFDNPPDPFQGSPHKDRIGYEYLILKEKLRKWLCSAVHSEFWRERGILLFVDCFVWAAISLDGCEWVKRKNNNV